MVELVYKFDEKSYTSIVVIRDILPTIPLQKQDRFPIKALISPHVKHERCKVIAFGIHIVYVCEPKNILIILYQSTHLFKILLS